MQGGEKELLAYLVGEPDLDLVQVRQYLSSRLPAYMVPAHLTLLDKLPLTVNGKLDKSRLPEPDAAQRLASRPFLAPLSPLQKQLAASGKKCWASDKWAWKTTFSSWGGHSLKGHPPGLAHPAKTRGETRTQGRVCLPRPRRAGPAGGKSPAAGLRHDPGPAPGTLLPLVLLQKRLWVLSQLGQANQAYNMAGVYHLQGQLQTDALQGALSWLVARHESLRTVFQQDASGEVAQVILPPQPLALPLEDLRGEDPHA
jgi:hypothetical protein